jgi:hypothetical protein
MAKRSSTSPGGRTKAPTGGGKVMFADNPAQDKKDKDDAAKKKKHLSDVKTKRAMPPKKKK